MKKDKNKLIVNDLNRINDDFFNKYNIDYWLYKICMLKECHDNPDKVFYIITKELTEIDIDDFKKNLRLDLHFLYFHLVETLFTLCFVVYKFPIDELWLALAFANDKDTYYFMDIYQMIKEFLENKLTYFNLEKEIHIKSDSATENINLLKFIFYFLYPINLSEVEWATNYDNIKKMMFIFARDFTDRGEYNAYKHSFRLYPSSFMLAFGGKVMGQSEDSINFIERQVKKRGDHNIKTERVVITNKPFNFERDYRCCLFITKLIHNIINSRKYAFLKDINNKKFILYFFHKGFNYKDCLWKTGVIRNSFTI